MTALDRLRQFVDSVEANPTDFPMSVVNHAKDIREVLGKTETKSAGTKQCRYVRHNVIGSKQHMFICLTHRGRSYDEALPCHKA